MHPRPQRSTATGTVLTALLLAACATPPPPPLPDPCPIGDAAPGIEYLEGSYRIQLLATGGARQGNRVNARLYLSHQGLAIRKPYDPVLYGAITESLRPLGGLRVDGATVWVRENDDESYDLRLGDRPRGLGGLTAHVEQWGTTGFGGTWEDEYNHDRTRSVGKFCAVRMERR